MFEQWLGFLYSQKNCYNSVSLIDHISPSLVYNCSQDGHLIRQLQHLKKNILIFETGCAILGSSDILSFYTSSCSSFPFRSFAGDIIEILINSRLFPALFYIFRSLLHEHKLPSSRQLSTIIDILDISHVVFILRQRNH